MQRFPIALAALALAAAGSSAQAVGLGDSGYTQNFDAMGSSGTTLPGGWRVMTGDAGTANSTWTTAIMANGASGSVGSMLAAALAPTASSAPTANNNNGYNAAISAGNTADRVLSTAPTTVSGGALELRLTNEAAASFSQLVLSYDTVRFTSVSTANELPGYQLFFSLDNGGSWSNLAALNPTLASVPNSVGVSTVSNVLVDLGAPLAVGQTLALRWVDDNARQTSPDQIIGLNNVSIAAVSAVPEPGMLPLMAAGFAVLGGLARRRRAVVR